MKATTLEWYLLLTPWWCVAEASDVRQHAQEWDEVAPGVQKPTFGGSTFRRLSRDLHAHTVSLWSNFNGLFLFERGRHLVGRWGPRPDRPDPDSISVYRYYAQLHNGAEAFVHPVTAAQVQRLAARYAFDIMGDWSDAHIAVLQELGLHPKRDL